MKKHKRYPNQIKDDKRKEYDEMETSHADMTDFRRPAYSVRHPKSKYSDTQNMSTAAALIRAQGEQIRRMSAEEYLIDKIGSDADGQESNLRLRGCEGTSEGDGGRHTE